MQPIPRQGQYKCAFPPGRSLNPVLHEIVVRQGNVPQVCAPCIRLQTAATLMNITFLVTLLVTFPNLRATSMAHSGVALLVWPCYLDDIEPPLRCCGCIFSGVRYETRSSVLRGVGVCGGSLDL